MKIRKVVSIIFGFSARFLPATKVMPTELSPKTDKPMIQFAVDEAIIDNIGHFGSAPDADDGLSWERADLTGALKKVII